MALCFVNVGVFNPAQSHSQVKPSPIFSNFCFKVVSLTSLDPNIYNSAMIVDRPIPFEKRTKLRIPPFSATVQAGFPSPADDHIDKSLDLNEHLGSNPASTFFVKAKGDSMKDAGIASGDTLIVDRSVTPKDKNIVVAMLDGEFTVKRLRRKKSQVFLVAENNAFPPLEITDEQELIIWGVVTFVIHQPK